MSIIPGPTDCKKKAIDDQKTIDFIELERKLCLTILLSERWGGDVVRTPSKFATFRHPLKVKVL